MENLKKKQQLPTTPTSLSALRETATAQPTISHLPSSPVADLPTENPTSPSSEKIPQEDGVESGRAMGEIVPPRSPLSEPNASFYSASSSFAIPGAYRNDEQPAAIDFRGGGGGGAFDGQRRRFGDVFCRRRRLGSGLERRGKRRREGFQEEEEPVLDLSQEGFECRCGGLFCAVHRYSDKHDCSFNYREMGAQEIRRNNPVVVGEKIQKI
ncbi:unnamed protein product [Phaedon cochleariae]|uniref:AN1-type domain-containing protein n=1 Tax=Phaedon cochleariae TaxID=80249 RepID=A0A9N9SD93_PHACE|nr:unnamed protein product [Phaedon cochleariae]